MIVCDLTQSYIQSYNFWDFATILNLLKRWDHKIAWFYDLNRDFDNHGWHHQFIDICKLGLKAWRHEHREEVVETWKLDQGGRGWNFRTWKLEVYQKKKKNFKAWKERKRLKLESLNREKVCLDFRHLKSEELNLKWVLGRREKKKEKKTNF